MRAAEDATAVALAEASLAEATEGRVVAVVTDPEETEQEAAETTGLAMAAGVVVAARNMALMVLVVAEVMAPEDRVSERVEVTVQGVMELEAEKLKNRKAADDRQE